MKPILLALVLITTINFAQAQISPVGSYDDCAAAINLTVNTTCVAGMDTYTTVGATASTQPSAGPSSDDDVWFKFTTLAGQTHAQVQIPTYAGGMGNCYELWASCSATSYITASCGSTFDVSGLSSATTYYVRVYTNGTFARMTTFQICVLNTTPPPAYPNDECAFATAIPVSTSPLTCNPTPITNRYALPSANPPSCLASSYRDIWLKFTPTSTGSIKFLMQNYTAITGSSSPLFYAAVYSGTCASPTLINCSSVVSGNEITLVGSYTSGSTYYIRLLCDNGTEGTFEVCLKPAPTTTTYPTAADSTCARAIPINASVNQSALYTNGSTNGIRVLSQRACYGSNAPNALAWYSFTVPNTGNYLVDITDFVRLSLNANGSGYRILKRSSCYSTGTDTIITQPPVGTYDTVLCVDNSAFNNQSVALTSGTQYYLTVMENSYNGGPVSYKLRVVGTTPPSNDDSTNATMIIQDVTCAAGNNLTTTRFSTLSTVPNPYALANNGTYTQDVWYKFVAATTSVNIITSRNGSSTRLAVYNSNGTIKYDPAANSSSITVNALTVGSTYLIRVLSTSAATVGSQADFTLCVFGVPSTTLAGTVGACTASDASKTSTGSGNWLHFTKAGALMVSVFDGPATTGATFTPRGTITTSYYTNTAGIRLNTGTAYLDRNFEISDGGNNFSNSPVKVRFYFTVAEFNTLVASTSSGGISAPYELRVYRIPSASCNSTTTAGGLYYNIVGSGYLSDAAAPYVPTGYYVDMVTPNFSGFFLQKAADNLLVPATCNAFTYSIAEQKVQLHFSTKTEINSSYFEVERSTDGTNFSTITTIVATNNSNGNAYQFTDARTKANAIYYYRLKQVDKDGSTHFVCNTIKVNTGGKQQLFGNAYPNPVGNMLTLDIQKPFAGKANIEIINAVGQILQQHNFSLQSFDTQLKLNTTKLNIGVYTLRITTADAVQIQQIIKR